MQLNLPFAGELKQPRVRVLNVRSLDKEERELLGEQTDQLLQEEAEAHRLGCEQGIVHRIHQRITKNTTQVLNSM